MSFKLSVLDLSPVSEGTSGHQTLQNTLDLARLADGLGYERYWLAEHHSLPNVASPAPEVMIGHVAAETSRMRVGSGGIMLPNHAPLKVAEIFRTLEALHPERIDLGIGRAPGTDPMTAQALRRSGDRGGQEFPEQFTQFLAFAGEGEPFPEDHPFANVRAVPEDVALPPIWLLGSSGYSAQASGEMGLGYAFAAHFGPGDPVEPMHAYREHFTPSKSFESPSGIVATSVICAEDDERARELASSMELVWVRMNSGRPTPLPSPEEALSYEYNEAERRIAEAHRTNQIVGGPDTVRQKIEDLAQRTAADEVMVTTAVYDHSERLRSYERLAEAFSLSSGTRSRAQAS
ncbi:MAG: LLM class flavin-dependent oxidoreductase [Rubrobacter sp.]|nr:LLM class flavin-dependent oxidoreductase [Rubrobacter sp.]